MPLLKTVMAALAVVFLFSPFAQAVASRANQDSAPREKEINRAEKIVARLQKLEATTAGAEDFAAYKAVVEKLYPGLFEDVAALREGDLKTDLTTAVFLYETAYRAWPTLNASQADCDRELRDLYRQLCRDTRGGTRLRLVWAKARTHTRWAASIVHHARGQRDRETLQTISEMRAERQNDSALAANAVAALRAIEQDVRAYASLAEFAEGREVANVSFKQFSAKVSETFRTVDSILASLPRGRVRQQIENARNSYRDGLFWWRKTHQRGELTVSADALVEADPFEMERLDPVAVGYTVIINWRNASKYTTRAEESLRSSVADRAALR